MTFGRYKLAGLLLCITTLIFPVGLFAECRVVEYPDHSEVVCEDETVQQDRQGASKAESTSQKEFVFYSPVNPVTRLTISADLSRFAIASPGDTLISYRAEVLRDKVYTPTSASFVYEGRSGDNDFTIREESAGDRTSGPPVTNVTLDDRKSHLLLIPFKSGCSAGASEGIYLKMSRFEGTQLYYRLIMPDCLMKSLEQSIKD